MMNMSSQLTVTDLDLIPLSNITFQKCWVNPVTLARIGGKLASHIMLTSSFCDVICQAFPNDQVQLDVIKYCKRVFKNNIGLPSLAENYMKNNVLKKIDKNRDKCIDVKQNSLVNVKLLKTAPAKQVEITLVADDYQNIKCFKKDLKYHSGKLEEMCRNLLLKFCVADGHVVSFEKIPLAKQNGLYCIVINSCYHDDNNFDGYIITQQTDICICKIVSKERHFQKSHEKSLEVGGLDREAEELCEILKIPFLFKSDLLGEFRKVLPKGILLRGPAGTGKTSLVRHVGNECNAFVVTINGPEVFGARPGETEENLTKIFDKVLIFSEEGPTILFLDEVDTLCPDKRNSDGEKEINSSRMLMDFFDRIVENDNIMVIGATNRPMSVDAGLRRPGRFDKEIMINVPNLSQRADILQKITSSLPLANDVNLDRLSFLTNGYVGADLVSVCREAALMVLLDNENSDGAKQIDMRHFELAVRKVMPSIKKGTVGLVELSPVDWSQIGGLSEVKAQIKQAVEWPIQHPEAFQRMGLPCPKGVLLYGPPGCCKTTLVRAAATATNATFIALSGAQLFSPYVGDSERLISEVFQKARAAAPSVVFLDEIDSIVGKRSEGSANRGVSERVLSSLLNEMDGIGIKLDDKIHSTGKILENSSLECVEGVKYAVKVENRSVLLVAATNRPDLLDDALVRPGRIDRMIYVPPPDKEARLEILKVYTKNMPICNVDIESLAESTNLFSGADLQNFCREAALFALTDDLQANGVTEEHFERALLTVEPSLTLSLLKKYSKLSAKREESIVQ